MNQPPLTRRQRQILDFFEQYVRSRGMSPTLEEVAHELGVNKVTVFGHVAELERKGVLARAAKGISRGLQVVQPSTARRTSVPLVGRIAAGRPIAAVEEDEALDLADLLPAGRDVYALRVQGDSMIEDSICSGDLVLVDRRSNPNDGDTVVAILEGEAATLKRFYREGRRVRLQPANVTMPAIYVDNVEIRGVVIGVIRRL